MKDESGSAFPVADIYHTSGQIQYGETGMTMRDYFAAKAMQAMMSGHIAHYGHETHWSYKDLASEAYDMAEAMLIARNT